MRWEYVCAATAYGPAARGARYVGPSSSKRPPDDEEGAGHSQPLVPRDAALSRLGAVTWRFRGQRRNKRRGRWPASARRQTCQPTPRFAGSSAPCHRRPSAHSGALPPVRGSPRPDGLPRHRPAFPRRTPPADVYGALPRAAPSWVGGALARPARGKRTVPPVRRDRAATRARHWPRAPVCAGPPPPALCQLHQRRCLPHRGATEWPPPCDVAAVRWRGGSPSLVATVYKDGRSRQVHLATLHGRRYVAAEVRTQAEASCRHVAVGGDAIEPALAKGPPGTRALPAGTRGTGRCWSTGSACPALFGECAHDARRVAVAAAHAHCGQRADAHKLPDPLGAYVEKPCHLLRCP